MFTKRLVQFIPYNITVSSTVTAGILTSGFPPWFGVGTLIRGYTWQYMEIHSQHILHMVICPYTFIQLWYTSITLLKVPTCFSRCIKTPKSGDWAWIHTQLTEFKFITCTGICDRFPLNFLHTFTVILPSAATRALANSNLPVTRSNFCFPLRSFPYSFPLNNSEQCFEC